MEQGRVLVVSDSPDRRNFLEYYIKHYGMTPIYYPNIFAAKKALNVDPFIMVVVDLSIPIETKISLIQESCEHHPHLSVITVGKQKYIEKKTSLSAGSSVIGIDSIDSFPDKLTESLQLRKTKS